MEGSPWRILLAAIVLIQLTYAQQRYEVPPDGKLIFNTPLVYADWPLSAQDTNIVYTSDTNMNHVFAFSVYDPSNKRAVIRIATTKDKSESTEFRNERCEYDFDVPDNSTVVLEDLWLRTHKSSFVLSFHWHVEGENEKHYGNVNSVNCHDAEVHRKREKNRKRRDSTTTGEDAATGYITTEPEKSKDDKLTKGDDAATGYLMKEPKSIKRHSKALDRYGVCWTGDKSVTCAQGPKTAKDNSSELTNWATVRLDEQAAFLGVYNYAENKMLVAVGNCERSDCDYFDLYEVRPDGKVFQHDLVMIYFGECRNQRDITVDWYYDAVRNQTCFDAVCISYTRFDYRRKCAKK